MTPQLGASDAPGKEPILVWPFHDAPEELKSLSQHGGDEDWVAKVPKCYAEMYIPWLDFGSFGVCEISKHQLEDGSTVFIGAHA